MITFSIGSSTSSSFLGAVGLLRFLDFLPVLLFVCFAVEWLALAFSLACCFSCSRVRLDCDCAFRSFARDSSCWIVNIGFFSHSISALIFEVVESGVETGDGARVGVDTGGTEGELALVK